MINILLDLLGIGDAVVQTLRTAFGSIAATIYALIEYIYHVFELLARAEIVSSDFINGIYTKVGTILSIFMIFKLSFSLIQSLIDPDKLSDKKNGYGQIIFRCIIAVVLLGITPAIFREAYNVQNLIVGTDKSTNVLYKLISGSSTNGNLSTIGRELSGTLYLSFFTDDEDPKLENGMNDEIFSTSADFSDRFQEDNYTNLHDNLLEGNISFLETVDYLTAKGKNSNSYIIEVSWIPLLGIGIFVLYMIGVYCIQVGIRVAQLAYLQLIAPIPILSYISDPDGTFKKWYNQCIKTYLDLFLRLAIIYFVMTLIGNVLNELTDTPDVLYDSTGLAGEPSSLTRALVVALVIVGLLLFAKKVPELLKELFPGFGSGTFDFGLSPKKVMEQFKGTPIALGGKAVGWLGKQTALGGKKLIAGTDSYIAGKGFWNGTKQVQGNGRLSKLRKSFDELTPNAVEERNKKKEFMLEQKEQEKARKIYEENNGKLTANSFKSKAYQETFQGVQDAKTERNQYAQIFDNADKELSAAYNYHGVDREQVIEKARIRRSNAQKNLKIAEGKLAEKERQHEKSKGLYTFDAEKERLFKQHEASQAEKYKDINEGIDNNNTPTNTSANTNPNANTSANTNTNSNNNNQKQYTVSDYEKAIEKSYEKMQELAANGEGDSEQFRKEQEFIEKAEKRKSELLNSAFDENNYSDSWASQGRADDSDNW